MGTVYVATDERFGSTVAIKVTLCMTDNYRKALEREARLLNSLKHAALTRVGDQVFVRPTPY
jgi:serine/threonine protein kinase